MFAWIAAAVLNLSTLQVKPEEISFKSEDGITIYGLLGKTNNPENKPAIICIPMFMRPKGDYRQAVITFASAGITTLAIDPRGHGSSIKGTQGEDLGERVRKKDHAFFLEMYKDVNAANQYLVEKVKVDPNKIGLLGASVGSSIAIHCASLNEKIAAVACMTPGENYLGMPTLEHLKGFGNRPILLITAKDEEEKGTKQIAEALSKNTKMQKMVLQIEKAHGTNIFNKLDLYSPLVQWFSKQFSGAAEASTKK